MNPALPHFARRCLVVWSLVLTAVGLPFSSRAKAADIEAPAEEEGFVPLLGEDARKTWVGYDKQEWPEGWQLADGVLHRSGSGGDLMTVRKYGDFDLRFEWKIAPGGNSGIMYRVSQEEEPAYYTGPEYQILDNAAHKDGKNPLTSCGSLYALYAPSKDAAKPAGEWNESRIVLKGIRVEHHLNGQKIVDAELGSDNWNKRVAASKFSQWKKFGKNKCGHLVLQDHGDDVWYRNLRIKEPK